jgi:hypothetical protein
MRAKQGKLIMHNSEYDNVIRINEWLKKLREKNRNQEIADYLEILTFNQLMTESSWIKKQITEKPLNKEIIKISKMFLKEIQKRFKKDSNEMYRSLKKIRNEIEVKVASLERLIS